MDVWDAFLDTLENRGLASLNWEIQPEVQEELIAYFKAKIDAGVSDGKTSVSFDLIDYIYRFPKEMRWALRAYAEGILASGPNNGVAVKFLAIETLRTYVMLSSIDDLHGGVSDVDW